LISTPIKGVAIKSGRNRIRPQAAIQRTVRGGKSEMIKMTSVATASIIKCRSMK
jgi:hypothetical protein